MRKQIYLLHFAGGNVYSFQFLKKYFSQSYEFIPLELPGRGKRMAERLINSVDSAVSDYVSQIEKHRNGQPFIVYGHSMGASLGLEVTKKMELRGDRPLRLIVSGNAGPGIHENKRRYLMDEDNFKNELRELGGVPEEVLNDPDLFGFFEPIMRADFEILESERKTDNGEIVLETPIIALMGDSEDKSDQISNWKTFSTKEVKTVIWSGNHFFIHDHAAHLAKLITEENA
jgi:external thioesterase TEII